MSWYNTGTPKWPKDYNTTAPSPRVFLGRRNYKGKLYKYKNEERINGVII